MKKNNFLVFWENNAHLFVWLAIIGYILVFSLLSILRYHTYRTGLLDLGVYDQPIWSILKGKFLHLSIIWEGCALASHINFILIPLAPFYLIWNDPQMLLILQTIFLGLGALPVYYLAKNFWNKKTGLIFGLSYLLYPGLQYTNLFDVHPIAFAIPLILFLFYFLHKENYGLVLLFALLSMMCQEDIVLMMVMISLYIIFTDKLKIKVKNLNTRKKIGIFLLLLSILWLYILAQLLIPYFNAQAKCIYKEAKNIYYTRYDYLGKNFTEIIQNIFLHPKMVLKNLITFPKIKNFILIFLPLGFLSFFNLKILILSLPLFFINFLSNLPTMYGITYHRTAALIPCLFISAILGVKYLNESLKINLKWLSGYLLIIAGIANIFIGSSPISLRFNFVNYRITKRHRKIDKLTRLIPKDASLLSSNHLGSHLSHRQEIYLFSYQFKKADYIFVDLSKHTEEEKKIIEDLLQKKEYKMIKSEENLYLMKKEK